MEEIRAALIDIYKNRGFTQIFPSRVEEYGLYMENQNFFRGECAAAFMGKSGKLLTFKPDTTLSIINGLNPAPCAQKLFYIDEIARSGRNSDFNFITQIGIEIIDSGNSYGSAYFSSAEAVDMALESLRAVGARSVLDISHQGFLNGLFDALKIADRRAAIDALRAKNENALPPALKEICAISEPLGSALSKIKKFNLNETVKSALDELEFLNKIFDNQNIALDFSATGDLDYYNGLILRGYAEGIPAAVLTGGRYDNLLEKMNKTGGAIGFAVSLSAAPLPARDFDSDVLIYFNSGSDFQKILRAEKKLRSEGKSVRLADKNEDLVWKAKDIINLFVIIYIFYYLYFLFYLLRKKLMLSIALPKGRLGDKAYSMFKKAGYPCPELETESRKLVFEYNGARFFLVKPQDVPVYVEYGAADVGAAGSDSILEARADVYEILDLGIGKCNMCAASCAGAENPSETLRVATKYVNIARDYYASKNIKTEIVKLNGSIELAPILGLCSVIVDIVETGATLAQNNLIVNEIIMPVSAKLIANKSAFKFKKDLINNLKFNLKFNLKI